MKFKSIEKFKNYCFNTHSLYLKNTRFKKWIGAKNISLFNFSNFNEEDLIHIKSGVEDAVRTARLHFKVRFCNADSMKRLPIPKNKEIISVKLLKNITKRKDAEARASADAFIFNNPIKSSNILIKDGEALTYVSEGIIFFTFDSCKNYQPRFLKCRAKHETFHLLGLNFHHEDTKVSGYKYTDKCNMVYNAPIQKLCAKCRAALTSFWKGIEYAKKRKFMAN